MSFKINNRTRARLKKRLGKSQIWIFAGAVVILVSMAAVNFNNNLSLDMAAYRPLLKVVAKGESGGNYNAYFGNPANEEIRFTEMTIAEVLHWQNEFVRQGNVSSAVGKYLERHAPWRHRQKPRSGRRNRQHAVVDAAQLHRAA